MLSNPSVTNCHTFSDPSPLKRDVLYGRPLSHGAFKIYVSVCVADVAFVVDNSGSIKDTETPGQPKSNWQIIVDFLMELVPKLKVGPNGTRIGLVEFGELRFLATLDKSLVEIREYDEICE